MDQIKITGGRPLKGYIGIGGSKNAALPIMAACLLTPERVTLSNIPNLTDVTTMASLLVHLGVMLTVENSAVTRGGGKTLTLCAEKLSQREAPYDIVRKMRASVMVLGPLVARFHKAKVSLPGGCAIGARPINFHLDALRQMGADITLKDGYVEAKAKGGLKGVDIHFPGVSVGATENIMMAATLAKGTTRLHNAAQEPEITDLAHCLVAMGAKIEGIGTNSLTIHGVDGLHSAEYKVMPDRIEAGTYMIATAVTEGDIVLQGVDTTVLNSVTEVLEAIGVNITDDQGDVRVSAARSSLQPVTVETAPYPGFPTDMQAQLMALLSIVNGASSIRENVFENRFMHVSELQRMGADITISGNHAKIKGVPHLSGAQVMATDLRASVSLVLAALAAEGETTINRVYHIDRGYERIEEKLLGCGAKIERLYGYVSS